MSLSQNLKLRLFHQHEALVDLIQTIDESTLSKIPSTGKWSPKQNIAHLAAYQLEFYARLNLMVTTESPVFDSYLADNDPAFLSFSKLSTKAIVSQLLIDRTKIIDFISQLIENQWFREGIHQKYGALTLEKWTAFFIHHEAQHLFTIFKLVYFKEN